MDRQGYRAARGRRQRFRPAAEGVEARQLPSGLMATLLTSPRPAVHVAQAGGAGGGAGGGMGSNGAPMTLADLGTPTPHEVARERFRATFAGPFLVGPPRFTEQGKQLLIVGSGTSTAFLKGDVRLGLSLPTTPGGTVTGAGNIEDLNVANTGNQLGIDLVSSPGGVDRLGRPTHMTWTTNGNSGGNFTGAIGEGTLDLRYLPGLQRHHGSGYGTALALFKGRVYVSGLTNLQRFNLNTI